MTRRRGWDGPVVGVVAPGAAIADVAAGRALRRMRLCARAACGPAPPQEQSTRIRGCGGHARGQISRCGDAVRRAARPQSRPAPRRGLPKQRRVVAGACVRRVRCRCAERARWCWGGVCSLHTAEEFRRVEAGAPPGAGRVGGGGKSAEQAHEAGHSTRLWFSPPAGTRHPGPERSFFGRDLRSVGPEVVGRAVSVRIWLRSDQLSAAQAGAVCCTSRSIRNGFIAQIHVQ
eukprot:4315282-Prymnesium_polylepis.1